MHIGNSNNVAAPVKQRMMKLPRLEDEQEDEEGCRHLFWNHHYRANGAVFANENLW